MKFILKSIQNGCRLGSLSEINSSGFNKESCTPLCLLYSRGGSVPHLTKDLLEGIANLPGVAQLPMTLLAENVEVISQYGKGLNGFAGLKEFPVYCSIQDYAEHVPEGHNSAAGVAIWGRGGKLTLNAVSYSKAVEALQPDWYQALCDSDTNQTTSRKRIRKSVDRTLAYLDECIEQQAKSVNLKKCGIIGVVEGGYSLQERLRSVRETVKRQVTGYCIEGLHAFGTVPGLLQSNELTALLSAVLAEIPTDKPRLLPGLWTPMDIIQAVRMGVDIFDGIYPYIVTSRGCALVFNYTDAVLSDVDMPMEEKVMELSLKDNRWSEDTRPIMERCSCYTCEKHTRAYICHLLATSELLAGVLLMIHNAHHFFGFFEAIREAIVSNSFDALERRVSSYSCQPVLGCRNVEIDSNMVC